MRSCQPQSALLVTVTAALLLAPLAGCSTTPGQGFTIFPAGNFLLETTERLRDQAPRRPEAPRELSKTVIEPYIIQPGDSLLIEPESLDTPLRFPADQTVLPDGTIDLGPYGRRIVAGKSVDQIEAGVRDAIRETDKRKLAVNVRLVNPRSAVYYVLGEVNAPGSFPLAGRETVLDGILAAGGLSGRASYCNIVLSRPTTPDGCRIVMPICYRHIAQMADTTTNYQLMPGDRIYVATRTLCEQLMFWKDKQSCKFCQACQSACPDAGLHSPHMPEMMPASMEPIPAGPNGPIPAVPVPPTTDPFADTVSFLQQNSNSKPQRERGSKNRSSHGHIGRPKATKR
jgi:protein involved in polysaccharide export with SLBB domain